MFQEYAEQVGGRRQVVTAIAVLGLLVVTASYLPAKFPPGRL
jgi:hypothetical protein